ncbi:hypothetical protein A9Q84_00540 [Halobacteriovorax marinus]|uniref:Uncharacterized protein n=1 Tax=Halobacteriovorax marinus TaxID=97084 RepID=A0A1Y5FBZ9_9BACT|nr:hypothetical protein A9Q84_00540 [Halobacteriovorax marinus]
MSLIKDTSYFTLAVVSGEDIKIAGKVIGHVENKKVTDASHRIIGYVVGNTIVNARDSLMATFNEGNIVDAHNHVIGHYDGGLHAGAGAAAFLTLIPRYAA